MVSKILGFLLDQFINFLKESLRDSSRKFQNWSCKPPQNVLHHFFCQTTKFLAEKTSGQLNIVATQQNLIFLFSSYLNWEFIIKQYFSVSLGFTRKYPLREYILGVQMHTTALDQL